MSTKARKKKAKKSTPKQGKAKAARTSKGAPEPKEVSADASVEPEPDANAAEPAATEPSEPTEPAEPAEPTEPAEPAESAEENGAVSIEDLVAALGSDEADASSTENTADEGGVADATDGVQLADTLPMEADDDLREVEGEASERLMSIVESLLFASDRPLTVKKLRRVLKEPTKNQIQLALKQLIADRKESGIAVQQVAGGFALKTNPVNAGYVQRLLQARPARLSRPQLETLAVVAYRQPVTRAEIDHIRGVDTGAVLRLLLERELLQIVGKKEEPGRPMLYGTTVKFLELFNLMSLRDLPDLSEFRELSDGTKETLAAKMGEDEVEVLGQEVMDFARDEAEREAVEAAAAAEAARLEANAQADADADPDAGPDADPDSGEPKDGSASEETAEGSEAPEAETPAEPETPEDASEEAES
jgi:segregation and condensation protein B